MFILINGTGKVHIIFIVNSQQGLVGGGEEVLRINLTPFKWIKAIPKEGLPKTRGSKLNKGLRDFFL